MFKQVRLAPFTSEVIPAIARWAEKKENAEFFRRTPPPQDWLSSLGIQNLWQNVRIIYEDEMPVGMLTVTMHDQYSRAVEYGLLIDKEESSHKSFTALEVMRAACVYAFDYMNVHKIYVKLLDTRTGLKSRLEGLGFTTEALLRDSVFFQGEYRNEYLLSCLKLEYKPKD